MDNRNVYISVHPEYSYPITVFFLLPKKKEDHEVLEGEFDFDHINYLWGMLKRYADIEGLDAKDLQFKIYDATSKRADNFKGKMTLLKTKDGRDWFDAPELFKFVE